jgi:hypothetical protein
MTNWQLNWEEERLHARSFALPGWNILESSIPYLHGQNQIDMQVQSCIPCTF